MPSFVCAVIKMNRKEFESLQKIVKARVKEFPSVTYGNPKPIYLTYENRSSTPGIWLTSLRLKAVAANCPRRSALHIYAVLRDTYFRIQEDPGRRDILQRLLYDIRREVWRKNRVVEVISDEDEPEKKVNDEAGVSVKSEASTAPTEALNQAQNSQLESLTQEKSTVIDGEAVKDGKDEIVEMPKKSNVEITKSAKSSEEENEYPTNDDNGCKLGESRDEDRSETKKGGRDKNGCNEEISESENESGSGPDRNGDENGCTLEVAEDGSKNNQKSGQDKCECKTEETEDKGRREQEKTAGENGGGQAKPEVDNGCKLKGEADGSGNNSQKKQDENICESEKNLEDNQTNNGGTSGGKPEETGDHHGCDQEKSQVQGGCNQGKSDDEKAFTPEDNNQCKLEQSGVENESILEINPDGNERKTEDRDSKSCDLTEAEIEDSCDKYETKDENENGCCSKISEAFDKENAIPAADCISESLGPIENALVKLKISE